MFLIAAVVTLLVVVATVLVVAAGMISSMLSQGERDRGEVGDHEGQ